MSTNSAHQNRWAIGEVVFGSPFLIAIVLQVLAPAPLPLALPRPFLTEQALGHPLLDGVVLKDVNLARGTHLATLPGDQVLLRSPGDPIAVLRRESGQDDSTGARTLIAFGFDLREAQLGVRDSDRYRDLRRQAGLGDA